MTSYVCTELAPNAENGYVACKNWTAYENTLSLTKEQVSEIGGILVIFFAALLGYVILTKAIKIL